MKKNILLTGAPSSGKTTVIKKVISLLNRPCKGFYTDLFIFLSFFIMSILPLAIMLILFTCFEQDMHDRKRQDRHDKEDKKMLVIHFKFFLQLSKLFREFPTLSNKSYHSNRFQYDHLIAEAMFFEDLFRTFLCTTFLLRLPKTLA